MDQMPDIHIGLDQKHNSYKDGSVPFGKSDESRSVIMLKNYPIAALCVSGIQNEDIQNILFSFHRCFKENGWKTMIFNSLNDLFDDNAYKDGEKCVFRLVNFKIVDVAVVYERSIKDSTVVDELVERANALGKTVIVVEPDKLREGCVNITFDEMNAFREIVTHLAEDHKFTRINCIAGIKGNPISEKRVQVYKDVLEEYGIPFDEKRFGYGDFYSFPTVAVMERFLENEAELPQAIVCINDSMAITVCEVLAERGYYVPDDIVVTGFDGIEQEKYCHPRLTTCRRDMDKLARLVFGISEAALSGNEPENEYVFPYTACISESCGCIDPSRKETVKSINALYKRTSESFQYNRAMSNMLTNLTTEQGMDELRAVLKQYIQLNTHLCLNQGFEDDDIRIQSVDGELFDEIMTSSRFFFGEDDVVIEEFRSDELLPSWRNLIDRDEPLVFHVIHNQDNVYGYTASYVVEYEFQYFAMALIKQYHFCESLNSCMSIYVHKKHLSVSNSRLLNIQNKIIMSFADLVESRDNCTGQHVKRTSEYLSVLVEHLAKDSRYSDVLTADVRKMMCKAAPLHDIGKIKVSDNILNKPGKLSSDEFEVIKNHADEGGYLIEKTLTDIEDGAYIDIAREMARHHHEKWDGSGYPYHLAGEDIPLCARIMAVVDVFDALTSKRVYKDSMSVDDAYEIVVSSGGTHFDPYIVEKFVEIRDEVEQILRNNPDAV